LFVLVRVTETEVEITVNSGSRPTKLIKQTTLSFGVNLSYISQSLYLASAGAA